MKYKCGCTADGDNVPVYCPMHGYVGELLSGEGLKHDQGKQPYFAMPLEVLQPLADVFAAGEKKYATFNCLLPFNDPSRRFYDGMMRHAAASQRDPLAIDEELKEQYGVEVYHLAQIAFNALLRLYHARKNQEQTTPV